jgi:cytochrome c oxidase assembly factor CtaG
VQYPWTLEPAVVAIAIVGAVLFLRAFVELRRRGRSDHAPWSRLVLFAAGLCAGVLPLVSPLDPIADRYLLSAHMLEHVLVGDAAPALLLLAVRGPLFFFMLPPNVLGPLSGLRPVRALVGFLLRPRVAVACWAVVMGTWHLPAAYDYTLTHQTVHELEHTCFFCAGLLVWLQLIDPAGRRQLSIPGRLILLATVFALGTVLSDVLIFSLRPLYPSYASQPTRLLGLAPMRDQQLAGIVMLCEQLLSLGTCAFFLLLPILRRPGARRARLGAVTERTV